jgi:hypothetical protein
VSDASFLLLNTLVILLTRAPDRARNRLETN